MSTRPTIGRSRLPCRYPEADVHSGKMLRREMGRLPTGSFPERYPLKQTLVTHFNGKNRADSGTSR